MDMGAQRRLLPSISAITAFESVERLSSFTAAAEELSLTQSAVSRQVKTLEEQLGCVLLERTSKVVRSTAEGAVLAVEARKALSILRGAMINAISGTSNAEVRLAILPTFGTRWLMPKIPDFVRRNPGVTLSFSSNIHPFAFAESEIDAAIYHGKPEWPGTEATLLMNEYLVPVAAPLLAQNDGPGNPDTVFSQTRLQLASRPTDWQKWFAAQGFEAQASDWMMFEQFSTLIQACIGGIGVALLPKFMITSELEKGELVKIGEPILNDESYFFIQPHVTIRHAGVDAFRDWLSEHAEIQEK